MSVAPLLAVRDLSVAFKGAKGARTVLSDVSFDVASGEILSLVGESGSGKSVTALAVMRLLGPQGAITAGSIRLDGEDLAGLSDAAMVERRGRSLAMVFQEPMTSLNPLFTIGFQIGEVLRAKLGLSRRDTRARVVELLRRVGIPRPEQRIDDYPHVLSGGMRQRVMIALSMACDPRLLLADEPTTALDVTIQAQILDLMRALRSEAGAAILLITHDMGVVARMADRVAVMYAGEIVEIAPVRQLFAAPAHPYTRLLMAAMPTARHKAASLPVIPGMMPSPDAYLPGCRFHPRCPFAIPDCQSAHPELRSVGEAQASRCIRAAELLSGTLA